MGDKSNAEGSIGTATVKGGVRSKNIVCLDLSSYWRAMELKRWMVHLLGYSALYV